MIVRTFSAATKQWRAQDPLLYRWILTMTVLSLAVYVLVVLFGFHLTPNSVPAVVEYKPYFSKPNWWGYPIFFLALLPIVNLTWFPFQEAWNEERSKKAVVVDKSGNPISKETRNALIAEFSSYRRPVLISAIFLSTIFHIIDVSDVFQAYTTYSAPEKIAYANSDPDFFAKWVFEDSFDQAHDFSPPATQIIIAVICYFQQFVLITLGFLVLAQIVMQILFFWGFEQLKVARSKRLMIRLDYRDPLEEFGLSDWNTAMDRTYWALALGLIIPLISALNQPGEQLDKGQIMADILIVILVLSPFLFTIFVRGLRKPLALKDARKESEEAGNEDAVKAFKKQTVWPLQKAKDKYGMLVCGVVLSANLTWPKPIEWLVDLVNNILG